MSEENQVVLVWKVPEDTYDESVFEQSGVYPSGELMAVCGSYEAAEAHIEMLRENSPSERFGDSEDVTENDMDDAPYQFATSNREVISGDEKKEPTRDEILEALSMVENYVGHRESCTFSESMARSPGDDHCSCGVGDVIDHVDDLLSDDC